MKMAKLALVVSVLLGASMASATDWPTKTTKIVVPYGAGGGVDTFTRPIAARLQEQLGHPFIIDNRSGAGGTIGVQAVAKSAQDGYTILAGGVHQPMAESLYQNRGYDLDKDFTPIPIVAVVPNVLVVHPKVPFKTVAELIAYAKANPDKVTYCSSGTGTSQHIIAEMFKLMTKVNMLHVPHRGTAPAMITLLGGQCDLMFDGMGTASSQIKAGKLRPLAVTTTKRSALFPAIPTMKEAGGPAIDVGTWYALWAPSGTPKDIVQKMRLEVDKALASPAIKETWKMQGAETSTIPADQLQTYVRGEIAQWTRINQQANIKLD